MLTVNAAIDSAGRFDGEPAEVTGTVNLAPEAECLLHHPRSEWRSTGPQPWRSAIWLDFGERADLRERARALHGARAIVRGRLRGFDPPQPAFGHLMGYGAEIVVEDLRPT